MIIPSDRKSAKSGFENIYIGDALNVANRIASSNTVRHYKIACSEKFFNRLTISEKKKYEEDDTYYDLNKYPEPIVLYGYKEFSKTSNQPQTPHFKSSPLNPLLE